MAKSKARIFLFHGNDPLISRRSLQRWEQAFLEKHEGLSHHHLSLDNLSLDETHAQLQEILHEQSLFTQPSLYVIYRPTAQEKGKKGSYSELLLSTCSQLLKQEREDVTVLIWEEKRLAQDHVMTKWFQEHESKLTAKSYEFNVPHTSTLLEETDKEIAPQALQYLRQVLDSIEKELRSSERLRSSEVLSIDTRRLWLESTLEAASLNHDGIITLENLKELGLSVDSVPTPFEVANSFERGQYDRALTLLKTWEGEDLGNYFVLIGILRQRYRTTLPQIQARYALNLLAELELLTKNGISTLPWLFELFCLRMIEKDTKKSLLKPRNVWLATQ